MPTALSPARSSRAGRRSGCRLRSARGGNQGGLRIAGIGGRFGAGVAAPIGLELSPELPCVARGEGGVASLVLLRRVMVSVKDNPGNGLARETVAVLGLGGAASVGLRLGIERGAAVVLDKSVTHLAAHGDAQDRVAGTVLVVVGHRLSASVAATENSAGKNRDGSDLVRTRAGPRVGHGTTVAEAGGEAQRLLNAEIVLDSAHHVVDKSDIFATGVGPTLVETVGRDEDGTVVACHQGGKTVPGKGTAPSVGDLLSVSSKSMEGKDKAVRKVAVIVVREADNIFSLFAVHGCRVLTIANGWCLATTRRACAQDRSDAGKRQKRNS